MSENPYVQAAVKTIESSLTVAVTAGVGATSGGIGAGVAFIGTQILNGKINQLVHSGQAVDAISTARQIAQIVETASGKIQDNAIKNQLVNQAGQIITSLGGTH